MRRIHSEITYIISEAAKERLRASGASDEARFAFVDVEAALAVMESSVVLFKKLDALLTVYKELIAWHLTLPPKEQRECWEIIKSVAPILMAHETEE